MKKLTRKGFSDGGWGGVGDGFSSNGEGAESKGEKLKGGKEE